MTRQPRYSRSTLVERARQRLLRRGSPRFQMTIIVALTGLAGFIASFVMLQGGLVSMGLRYLLAVGIAYLIFLAQLWLWLRTGETVDDPLPSPASSRDSGPDGFAGKGGQPAGGGSSSAFDLPGPLPRASALDAGTTRSTSSWPVIPDLGDADEFTLPLVVVIAIVALVTSFVVLAFSMVWTAPVLFAELLVDGVLAASLYRRLRGVEASHWLETALRRTFWPFLVTALIAAAVGWVLQQYQPSARTIGDVMDARVGDRGL